MIKKILLGFFFALLFAIIAAKPSPANTDSPQGALDVAGIIPGHYTFLDRQKYPRTNENNSPQPSQDTPKAALNKPDQTVSAVAEIMELMKQATEIAASMPEEDVSATPADSAKASAAMPPQGAHAALNIASMLPRTPMGVFMQVDPLQMIKSRQMIWPTDGFIYSAFKATRGKRRHGAIDIVNKKGTPIVAAADGVISVVANGGKNFSGYGRVVIIDHGKGVHTLYSHCNTTPVKIGQKVKQGELIATMGRTGRASTDHLHFEVRVAGKKIDPLACIPERPGVVKATNYHTPKKKAN